MNSSLLVIRSRKLGFDDNDSTFVHGRRNGLLIRCSRKRKRPETSVNQSLAVLYLLFATTYLVIEHQQDYPVQPSRIARMPSCEAFTAAWCR